ncbi:MAG: hypothetical protein M0T74_10050 [Desulfitobacterium hafniense]|nr:hypothetical protein [Desulfitobacterium hafniense]
MTFKDIAALAFGLLIKKFPGQPGGEIQSTIGEDGRPHQYIENANFILYHTSDIIFLNRYSKMMSDHPVCHSVEKYVAQAGINKQISPIRCGIPLSLWL